MRHILKFGLATAFAAMAISPANAAPTRTEVMAQAGAGVKACAEAMPDTNATAAALKAAGYRLYETNGHLRAYMAPGNRVAVAITTAPGNLDACLVVVSKMNMAEATALIQPWLKASQAKALGPRGTWEQAWVGTFKNGPVELAIEENLRLGIINGAAIMARSAQ